ncbi:MAG TPA: hypothetical protein VNV25_25270 [Gemmatimonadaceae bacterium]|jgi:hypothetical protein|nr:hypothetical protein [Gemmatimonadaceae bacterium]
MRNHDRAKAYLDAHMRYMRSDLTDLRVVIDEACAEAVEEEKAEHREMIRSLLVTLQYPDLWEKRVTKALDYLDSLSKRYGK